MKGGNIGMVRGRMDDILKASRATWMERTGYEMRFNMRTAMGDSPQVAELGTLMQHRNAMQNNPNLTPEQRQTNEPLVAVLNARIAELVTEAKKQTKALESKSKNIDRHAEN